jgi:hypothetical protein
VGLTWNSDGLLPPHDRNRAIAAAAAVLAAALAAAWWASPSVRYDPATTPEISFAPDPGLPDGSQAAVSLSLDLPGGGTCAVNVTATQRYGGSFRFVAEAAPGRYLVEFAGPRASQASCPLPATLVADSRAMTLLSVLAGRRPPG